MPGPSLNEGRNWGEEETGRADDWLLEGGVINRLMLDDT